MTSRAPVRDVLADRLLAAGREVTRQELDKLVLHVLIKENKNITSFRSEREEAEHIVSPG